MVKIAIQGHPTRGKEVIQILESLGGKNAEELKGIYKTFYYIDDKSEISDDHKTNFPPTYKLYTLEEFEKEFPFKIGDKVFHIQYTDPFTITAFNPEYVYPYVIKGVCIFNVKSCVLTKCESKMKKERNITLTLDKAKEWYKKGGELKEVALQAFTEEELSKVELPKSWEEFCANYPIQAGEAIITAATSRISPYKGIATRDLVNDRNACPSQKSAEAHLALIQLEQLRDCWWNGWKPDWQNTNERKYAIRICKDETSIEILYITHAFLSFPTYELALEFQECFKDLIEKAGDLI